MPKRSRTWQEKHREPPPASPHAPPTRPPAPRGQRAIPMPDGNTLFVREDLATAPYPALVAMYNSMIDDCPICREERAGN